MATDLPNQNQELVSLTEEQLADLRELLLRDLFFFGEAVMGYHDLTEHFHRPICDFIDEHPSRFKLIQLPRSAFKSSLCTISQTARNALKYPNRRYLFVNEIEERAQQWLVTIRGVYEEHPILRAVFSDIIPKQTKDSPHWSAGSVTLNRTVDVPEPTIRAAGITTSLTGSHFTDILVDDPISERAREEPSTMEKAISRISKMTSFFVDPTQDRYTLVGTPWAKHDVFDHFKKAYGKKLAIYWKPAVLNDQLTFPERLNWDVLEQARKDMGELDFSAQYLLNPRDATTQDFLSSDFRYFQFERNESVVILLNQDGTAHRRLFTAELDITMTVDLAISEGEESDRNAIVVVGATPDGIAIVLETWADRCTPIRTMRQIFDLYKKWGPRVVGIEGVAYQKAMKYFLRADGEHRETYLPIRDIPALGKKVIRIRGLQPIAASGRLYLGHWQTLLRQELLDFPDPTVHDDVLDALSMHLGLFTGVLNPKRVKERDAELRRIMGRIDGYHLRPESDDDEDDDWIPYLSTGSGRVVY